MLPKRGVRVMNYRHVTFWAIVFVILCALLWLLREVLLPFVAGMGLAYVLAPVADRLERAGLNRTVAALSIVGLVILSLIAVALLILPLAVQQSVLLLSRPSGAPAPMLASLASWTTTSSHGSPALSGEAGDSRPHRRCRVWAEGAAALA